MDSVRRFARDLFFRASLCYFVFAGVSLILVSGFFSRGYILTLDMVFTKNVFHVSSLFYGLTNSFSVTPLFAFLDFLNILFSVEFIQKLSFFLIFFLSGISAYKMCPEEWGTGKYFAGFLYMINPFVYVRVLAGHWLLLLAYAVTPFAVKSFMDFFKTQSFKKSIYVAFLLTLVFALETHTPFLLLIVFGIFFLAAALELRKKSGRVFDLSKSTALVILFLLVLNSYWLVPSFTGSSVPLGEITNSDLYTFTTRQDLNFNTLFTTASMYGFWRVGYVYTKDLLPYWYLFFIVILFLAVHGFASNYKHSIYVKAFGVAAVLSVILAAGISGPFAGVFEFLFNNVFFFKGFREPQKFAALLVLAYAYLGGLGVAEFERIALNPARNAGAYKKIGAWLMISLAIATPFIYSFTMFNGFWGQLKPTDYPKDWYDVNDYLNSDKQDFNILFLPWHNYMDFKWIPNAQKRIANPASVFFDKPVIQGDNMEAGSIYSSSTNPISRYIGFMLANRNKIDNFGELVSPLNIKYVVLTKEVDYRLYDFLDNQSDLEPVKDTENLVVFRNKHSISKFYQVDGISTIKDWEDLLEISKTINISSSAFILGDAVEIRSSQRQALNYTIISPVKYMIEKPSRRYVVYSEKYSEDWRLGGKMPAANFGVTNVYDASEIKGLAMYYEKFNVYLAGYMISGVSFVMLLILYYRESRRKKDDGLAGGG